MNANTCKNTHFISVIMPAFNAENTIVMAIESVLHQTYDKYELIIIDDCSTDATYELVTRILREDSRIILLKNNVNIGVSETRNYGVSKAKGEWIAFLDSDDMWTENKLEKQVELIAEHVDASIIYTGSTFIDCNGNCSRYKLQVPSELTYKKLLKQNLISCSSVLVRKGLLSQYKMKNYNFHEDFAVWLQVLRDNHKAYGINEPLLIYRMSIKSKSGNKVKAAMMTYRVYRYVGLSIIQSLYYFWWYGVKNLIKYKKIRAGFID